MWLWGNGWFGFWEASMTGPGAYNINGGVISGTNCNKKVPIMGFNYDQGMNYAYMMHSLGHRVESTMAYIHSGSRYNYAAPGKPATTAWDHYSTVGWDINTPAGCGHAHGNLNNTKYVPDKWIYDYSNSKVVKSNCDDWYSYAEPAKKLVKDTSCTAWGCTQEGFMHYFLSHLPNKSGSTNEIMNNWWKYVIDYNNPQLLPDITPSPKPSPTPIPQTNIQVQTSLNLNQTTTNTTSNSVAVTVSAQVTPIPGKQISKVQFTTRKKTASGGWSDWITSKDDSNSPFSSAFTRSDLGLSNTGGGTFQFTANVYYKDNTKPCTGNPTYVGAQFNKCKGTTFKEIKVR